MPIRGRVRAIPFAAAIAAVSVGPLAAAPPLTSSQELRRHDSWKLPEITPAPPRHRANNQREIGAIESRANAPAELSIQEIPTGPQQQTPPSLSESNNVAGQVIGAHAVSGGRLEQNVTWVTILGDVARQGSYEIVGDSITLAELMGRCGGLLSESECSLSIIRNSQFFGVPRSAHEVLRPGDLLVVLAKQLSQPAQDVRVGIVGLPGCPAAVMVPRSFATLDGILSLARQTHLQPGDIKVLLGGEREATGDHVIELTDGSVLVFDPLKVSPIPGLDLKSFTNFYPAPKMPGRLDRSELTRISLEAPTSLRPTPEAVAFNEYQTTPQGNPASGSDLGALSGPSFIEPASAGNDISSLPSVEFLEPPTEMPALRFPRTADASGETPIGPPEAESHIVPMPIDIGNEAKPKDSEAKAVNGLRSTTNAVVVPEPIELPDEESSDAEEPSAVDLVPTIAVGAVLGGLTFFVLRRFRNREYLTAIRTQLFSRLSTSTRNQSANFKVEPNVSGTPSEMLAALVADRLAFREEKVDLPTAMRVYGRSPALQRRRFDPAAASLAGPHFPVQSEMPTPDSSRTSERTSAARSHSTHFRVDSAEGPKRPIPKTAAGTPFERALATLREDQQLGR